MKVADAVALMWGTRRRDGESDMALLGRAVRRRSPPRALDLRGFRMTRREAAGWIRAADALMDLPPDSHASLADNVETASREELIQWSRCWGGQLSYEVSTGTTKADEPFASLSRVVQACLIAAARGMLLWRPKLCAMRCGRPALRAPAWEPDAGAVYCDECDSDGPEVPEAPRLRALWRMATMGKP